ncbi:hypothetical protein ACFL5Q_07950, partial [Planctomycetota bacterium]
GADAKPKAVWNLAGFEQPKAMALSRNAVLVAGRLPEADPESAGHALTAMAVDDGRALWSRPLPASPTWWGLATDRDGRIVTVLEDGRVLCFARAE